MIQVRNLSKVFRIPHAESATIYHNLLSIARGRYKYEDFYALKNVSFSVAEGEFVGIVGRNGSGKSTLLKIISSVYAPSSGTVAVRDEVFPMLELGVGFQRDFSVRDNIYLYSSLLGFSRKEMRLQLDYILDFAELTRFADAKFEKLSTGMQTRLGFAIAAQSTSRIVLVDEVLAVGDKPFKDKCRAVFKRFQDEGRTMVLVSHDTGAIQEYCDRVLVLNQGELIGEGPPREMVNLYTEHVLATDGKIAINAAS